MRVRRVSNSAAVLAMVGCLYNQSVLGADIHGLGLESLMPSIQALMPNFQKTTGHKITFNYGNSSTLPARLDTEAFDVVFASTPIIDRLSKQGKLAAGSQIN